MPFHKPAHKHSYGKPTPRFGRRVPVHNGKFGKTKTKASSRRSKFLAETKI